MPISSDNHLTVENHFPAGLNSIPGKQPSLANVMQTMAECGQMRTLLHIQASALEAAANAIVITENTGRIIWANSAFTRLSGYSLEEIIGQTPNIFKSGHHSETFYRTMWETILAGETWHGEIINRRKDGSLGTEELTITPLKNAAGEVTHFINIKQDITERKRHEHEMETLLGVAAAMRTATNSASLIPIILDQLAKHLRADGSALGLLNPITQEIVYRMGQGELKSMNGLVLCANEGISGQVIYTRRPYLSNQVQSDPAFTPREGSPTCPAVVFIPLVTPEQVVGVLVLGRKTQVDEDDLRLLTAVGDIAANAISRSTLHESTELRLQRFSALRDIDRAINASLDLRTILTILLEQTISKLAVDAAMVLLYNPITMLLEPGPNRGFHAQVGDPAALRMNEPFAGTSILEQHLIFIPNLRETDSSPRFQTLAVQEGFTSYCVFPLMVKGQVKGALEIFHRSRLTPDPEWLDFFEALAGQAAIAVDNAELFDNLQRSNQDLTLAYEATIEGWSQALELRDQETEGHSQRVTEMTLHLARALGLSTEELVHVRRGVLLHDIGKMGIPDNILLKAGPLTPDEWTIMRKHPVYAYQLLSSVSYLRPAIDIPYCHHEKWDGTGYPRGLKGEQIPLAVRAFSIVDVWDALSFDRPYRKAWPQEKVLAYIDSMRGQHFDPQMVDLFLELYHSDQLGKAVSQIRRSC